MLRTERQGEVRSQDEGQRESLKLTGYRLPTEAEWEYACRAGTLMTSRDYSWNRPSSVWLSGPGRGHLYTRPPLISEPNELGLFDMMGASGAWCVDLVHGYRKKSDSILEDEPTTQPVEDGNLRAISSTALFQSSASPPDSSHINLGFRPARTYP